MRPTASRQTAERILLDGLHLCGPTPCVAYPICHDRTQCATAQVYYQFITKPPSQKSRKSFLKSRVPRHETRLLRQCPHLLPSPIPAAATAYAERGTDSRNMLLDSALAQRQ